MLVVIVIGFVTVFALIYMIFIIVFNVNTTVEVVIAKNTILTAIARACNLTSSTNRCMEHYCFLILVTIYTILIVTAQPMILIVVTVDSVFIGMGMLCRCYLNKLCNNDISQISVITAHQLSAVDAKYYVIIPNIACIQLIHYE